MRAMILKVEYTFYIINRQNVQYSYKYNSLLENR